MNHKYFTEEDRKAAGRAAFRRHKKRQYVFCQEYKSERGCLDCGIVDPDVLQFDHKDRSQKLFNIGDALSRGGVSYKRLLSEMNKCDIRCANCHLKKSKRDKDWEPVNTVGYKVGKTRENLKLREPIEGLQ